MFIYLKWDIFLKMRFLLSKIMSKMTHIHYKNKNKCFQILLQTVVSVKQVIRNCIIFHWYFSETLYKTSDCYHKSTFSGYIEINNKLILTENLSLPLACPLDNSTVTSPSFFLSFFSPLCHLSLPPARSLGAHRYPLFNFVKRPPPSLLVSSILYI